jgi:cell division protein FtsI/penicillin-binding protein 2
VIVLEPSTGRVLAEAGRDHGVAADVAFGATFVPGSTFKIVVISAALEAKTISKESRLDCATRSYGDKAVNDASPHGTLALGELVAVSSNVGVTRILDGVGGERFLATARRFHFGARPAGPLPGSLEASSFQGALAAIGEGGVVASPAQIAAAYAAIAAGGVYHAPSRRDASAGERVVSAETASAVLDLLDGAVNGEHATGANARVEGVRVAGKTGTADVVRDGSPHTYASFVGVAPREAPRFVILVSAEIAAPAEQAYGGKVAAPVFARILRRAL